MTAPLFLWCHETWQQPFETGVQRVVRRLSLGLVERGFTVVPVGWDWLARSIKTLGPRADHFDQALRNNARQTGDVSWLLVPELCLSLAAQDLDPVQLGRAYGLKTAAWLHDLIPLKLRGDYDDDFVAHFRRYATMFAAADLVFTTTNYVADDLRAELQRTGSRAPEIRTVSLAAQFATQNRCTSKKRPRAPGEPLRLLTVSTWEPRKNLPRLLRAIREAEIRSNSSIELTVVGQRGYFAAYDAEVAGLIAKMPSVIARGSITDEDLAALYSSCHASVYPSIEEGFGLPIRESLWLATPCLCHDGSSMAEVAPGGGTLMVDMTDETAIVGALCGLVKKPDLLDRLSAEAVIRPLASWTDYASEIARNILSRRPFQC